MNIIPSFLVLFGLLIIAMTVHEFAHALVAYKLGDTTAKYSGRLSLNPLAHIDPVWTFLLPLFLFISTGGQFVFGAAKPVPINYSALRNPKRDIIWIGISGPMANFLLALASTLIIKFIPLPLPLYFMLIKLIVINVVLGVFNLIPIPPLDGSRIVAGLLPEELAARYSLMEPYGFLILMLLLWLGLIGTIVWPFVGFILKILGVPS